MEDFLESAFCNKDGYREAQRRPFLQDGHVIFTDGVVMCAVPVSDIVTASEIKNAPDALAIMDIKGVELELVDLPTIQKPDLLTDRWELECDLFDFDLDGYDRFQGDDIIATHIEANERVTIKPGFDFAKKYIWAISQIPGVICRVGRKDINRNIAASVMWFHWDGGFGCVIGIKE